MELAARPNPDDTRRLLDLTRLENQMAARQQELSHYRTQIEAFERRYFTAFGGLYAEIDALEVDIALKEALYRPADASKQRKAERLRTQAEERVYTPTQEVAPKPRTDAELRQAYLALSKRVHPDLAGDAADRARREALMVQANAAYAAGDRASLASLLSGEAVAAARRTGETLESARVEERIKHLAHELQQLELTLAAAQNAELARLMRHWERAGEEGRDLFAKLARELDEYRQHAQKRLKTLTRRLAKRAKGEPQADPA